VSGRACEACLRRNALIGLLAARIEGLLGDRRRAGALLTLDEGDLLAALGADPDTGAGAEPPGDLAARADDAGLTGICRHDPGFPRRLHDLLDPPPLLWLRGREELLHGPAVAIVGTRRASDYGLELASALGRGLGAAGVTVVSGLALGIDAAAHRGALSAAGGRTVAVLACGADVAYPRRHARLYAEIAEHGAVVSELPPGVPPFRWSFPARNRIMAALAEVTIVVEAAERSGSLITASFAADLGRGVCAVPGRVTARNAAGSNRLLRDGAAVIRDAADALDELFGIGAGAAAAAEAAEGRLHALAPDLRAVLDEVESGHDTDRMAEHTGLGPAELRRALGQLEALGLIARSGFAGWERRA